MPNFPQRAARSLRFYAALTVLSCSALNAHAQADPACYIVNQILQRLGAHDRQLVCSPSDIRKPTLHEAPTGVGAAGIVATRGTGR